MTGSEDIRSLKIALGAYVLVLGLKLGAYIGPAGMGMPASQEVKSEVVAYP